MGKSTHLLGQPSYLQLIKLLDRVKIDSIIRKSAYNRYIKKFDAYNAPNNLSIRSSMQV